MASTHCWASGEGDNRIDSLARNLAENVLREISQRNIQNEYLRSIGAAGSVDFIIDMRKWHISKESPSLASSPFLTSDQEKNLNGKLNQFYDDYRHPVYVVLSPIVHGSYEFSTQGLKDVYDWLGQEMSFSDFQKLKERYGEYLKELQKYNATAPTITGALSHGAVLSVESYIFYKSNTKNWMVRYGSDFTVTDEIKRASFIEDEYETATKDASKFEFAGKRYAALDNHTNAIISAFRNNCLTYTKLGQLAAILKDNLAELNKPIYVKVMEPKTWALEKRKYYLDKREQERYENPLEDTQGGGLFFAADDDGYINLNDLKADGQKANMIGELPKVVELFSELEKLIINVGVLWDIWRKSGDFDSFLNGDKSKAEILLGEAKDGKLQDISTLPDVVGLRKESFSKISYDLLSEDEMRVAINALYSVQEALKYTFGDKSLYPFAQVENLERIKVSPLEKYKLTPAKSSEELLKQLKYIYENDPSSLTKEEIQMYFDLLCQIEGDCRNNIADGGLNIVTNDWVVDISRVKKIGGRFPINAQDYAGKNYSFDINRNIPLQKQFKNDIPSEVKLLYQELYKKYPDGVDFDVYGYPRFEKYTVIVNGKKAEVKVKTKGNRDEDFSKADDLMKINKQYRTLNRLTWHHLEDTETMILLPMDLHSEVKHSGGVSVEKNNLTEE
ncbi:HNH endonuclease [Ohtaekwangia sp.]|uniref:HNH endonuclease signature motif containing protein n=1 Tax=Ohtaekwangia sp. TaxID=2066019 RepID=UPI002F93F3B7